MSPRAGNMGWRWEAVAALVVLALLGHGLLMTGDAHAAPLADHHHAEAQAEDAAEYDGPSRHGGCAVLLEVATPSGNGTGLDPGPVAATLLAVPIAIDGTSRLLGWEEPSWPPGVRRALVQVYRI